MTASSTELTFLHTGNPTGLKFLVEHGDARCLFDFGREHAPGRALFSFGLEPRPGREVADLIAVGAAPALRGVYAGDAWDGRTHVFISHMHLDHTGLIPFLGPDVPLYYPAAIDGRGRRNHCRWPDPRPLRSCRPRRTWLDGLSHRDPRGDPRLHRRPPVARPPP